MSIGIKDAQRPAPDQLLVDIATYVDSFKVESDEAINTARYCLMDTLGCGLLALNYPACTKLLGPVVAGADMQMVPESRARRMNSTRSRLRLILVA